VGVRDQDTRGVSSSLLVSCAIIRACFLLLHYIRIRSCNYLA
jgi:hypothetical protein